MSLTCKLIRTHNFFLFCLLIFEVFFMIFWICSIIRYESKTHAYGTALTGAWPFLQHGSQLTGGKPPGPPDTHV